MKLDIDGTDYWLIVCVNCGIQFAVPKDWKDGRRKNHESFWCPNGHSLSYTGESDTEKAERLAREAQAALNEEKHLRLVAEKLIQSEINKRKRIEKRIAGGVCPCCNRSFENLHRHMETKHKDYALPPAKPKEITGTIQ